MPFSELCECQLPADLRQLVEAAKNASYNAYAPYSNFHVGAAVLLADGTIVTGSNQENAAYPSGLCAERVALFSASSNHPNTPIIALALTARGSDGLFTRQPISPCGSCRQVLLECQQRAKNKIKVILTGRDKTILINDAAELLPLAFSF
ncbi:MAG: cytidine deaminase [Paludibacteraceae bacterium]|nr:cytidine deaminase [Paludibacteraceae bacterium]